MHVQAAAETRIGRRTSNQDSFCVAPDLGLYVVADGMGGYAGGELASTLTVEAVERFVRRNAQDADLTWPRAARRELSCNENILQLACELAHGSVRAQRHGDQAQMGSTVAAMLIEHDTVVIGHVGDSRVYRLRDAAISLLTCDHSLYEELRKASGERPLPPRHEFGYGNVITRAIGIDGHHAPDLRREAICPGDRYLLCSDGLVERLSDKDIQQLLGHGTVAQAACVLVEQSLALGSRDNVTVVVVETGGSTTTLLSPT